MNCCFLLEETTQTSADRMAVRKMLNLASAWRSLGFEPQTQQMLWAAVASIASPQRRISLEITLTGTIPMMPTEPKRYWNEICPFFSPFIRAFLGVVVGLVGGFVCCFLLILQLFYIYVPLFIVKEHSSAIIVILNLRCRS